MMQMQYWAKLPKKWIVEYKALRLLKWDAQNGSNNIAALMILVSICHYADRDSGIARLTYDKISSITDLSRSKISKGIKILIQNEIIKNRKNGHAPFELNYFGNGFYWGKLPFSKLYKKNHIDFFFEMKLRKQVELNALKLYLFLVAMRNDKTNLTNVTYKTINEYTGIRDEKIKQSISFLAAFGLIHVEHVPSLKSQYGIANAYRISGINDNIHLGTRLRGYMGDLEKSDSEISF